MELSLTPVLDAAIITVAFLIKVLAAYFSLKIVGAASSQVSFVRSFLVTALIVVAGIFGTPQLAAVLPSPSSTLIVSGIVLFICAIFLNHIVCESPWIDALVAAFVLVLCSMGVDYYVPKVEAALLPEGASFSEFSKKADEAARKSRANATNEVAKEEAGIVARGLDALATLTTKSEMEAMRENLSRGIELLAERKKLMDEMTADQLAEYRREMAKFMVEQGIAENNYSLSKLWNISSNDVAALIAALQDAIRNQNEDETDRPIRSIAESLITISENMTSLKMTEEDIKRIKKLFEMFSADEMEKAMAQVRADIDASDGKDTVAIAVLEAMMKMEPMPATKRRASSLRRGFGTNGLSMRGTNGLPMIGINDMPTFDETTTREPEIIMISIPCSFGDVKLPSSLENRDEWVGAADELQIKGFAQSSRDTVVLLTNGTLLYVGDQWQCEYKGVKYTFILESVRSKKITLVSQINTTVAGGKK